MTKLNYYNNIAQIYDQTRWLTESVAEEVADFIIELTCATPETFFLELGVGTGLNVLPLIKRGYSVTGIDISQEMLDRFCEKINGTDSNLKLLCQDASQLPFPDNSFDVILTVHMIHTVSDWKIFLDDIDRVLKSEGFYLNCQWITPPKRKEFEGYFRAILSKYEGDKQPSKYVNAASQEIDVDRYLDLKGYKSSYYIAKQWTVNNTVAELLSFLKLRAYGFCWQVSDEIFHQSMNQFEEFCVEYYSSLETVLSSDAKFEIWTYGLR